MIGELWTVNFCDKSVFSSARPNARCISFFMATASAGLICLMNYMYIVAQILLPNTMDFGVVFHDKTADVINFT